MKLYNALTSVCLSWFLAMPAIAQQPKIVDGNMVTPVNQFMYLESELRSDLAPWSLSQTLTRENVQEALRDSLMSKLADTHFSVGNSTEYDLNGDGVHELLVTISSSNSGGTGFAILEKKKSKWKLIGWIQGGFNIEPPSGQTGEYARIETWSRHGGIIYHQFWRIKKGFYRVYESIEWPKEFSNVIPPFDLIASSHTSPATSSNETFMANCKRACAIIHPKNRQPAEKQQERAH